jgi:hypothetical protein
MARTFAPPACPESQVHTDAIDGPFEGVLPQDHLFPARAFRARVYVCLHQQIYLYDRLIHPQYNTCTAGEPKRRLKLTSA